MPAPPFLDKLPRPVIYGLYGTLAGLLAALTVGELVWYLLRPPPPPEVEAHTAPPVSKQSTSRFAVTVSPKVQVYPGGSNFVTVRVARDKSDDGLTITFPPTAGLSGGEFSIPPGETTAQAEITAVATTKPGTYKLTVTATAPDASPQTTTVEVTVLPLPPAPPRLAVSLSPKVQAYQRGKNTFAVKVARGEFAGDVTVSFDRLPAGVTIPEVTIPAGDSEAVAELTAEGTTKTGLHTFGAIARAAQTTMLAPAEAQLEVLASPKLPVDVAFVLDCTGSMRKAHAGIESSLAKFGAELTKAQLEPRFALVGFQDRTLGQMLQVPQFAGEPMTTDVGLLRGAVSRLRLGGGGGEGDSSLDGIARAAESPFREAVPRVVLLITDGAPKKVDWRIKSMDEMVKYLKEKKIDQLHVAALPEHRKAFEPVWDGAKGKYLDLAAANTSGDYDKLMTDLGRLVWESLPERPENKPASSGMAVPPTLPPVGSVKPPALPPGAEPDEPKIEKPAVATPAAPSQEVAGPSQSSKGRRIFAAVAWAFAVIGLVCGAIVLGQMKFLPGEPPTLATAAAPYGVGLFAGLAAGAVGFFALDALGVPFLARLAGGCGVGLGFGLLVPLEQMLRQESQLERKKPAMAPPEKPLELDAEPKLPAPAPVAVPTVAKPAITPAKARGGCPGCGRTIPGEPGKRYCMLCDKTF